MQKIIPIKKVDGDRQIIYGEVYAPNEIDAHGDMMSAKEIEQMAHKFMQKDLTNAIDVQHSRQSIMAYPVESFIARSYPDYTEGSWVLAVKVEDTDVWSMIKSGQLNGYSFDAYGFAKPGAATIDFYKTDYGRTEVQAGHDHAYYVEFDMDGQLMKGRTSVVNGHYHEITKGTATDKVADHSHRFFL